ncbi:MAG: type II toxin-antitoxin system mRNA interferase toxin, RelE/StbE family [Candidatus Nanoarchaeia archaeon]
MTDTMYDMEISEQLDKKLTKLAKKNKDQLKIIENKTDEILRNPHRYKNLRGDMKGAKRVHIDTHFVLVFEVHEKKGVVRFLDFDHHDKIY